MTDMQMPEETAHVHNMPQSFNSWYASNIHNSRQSQTTIPLTRKASMLQLYTIFMSFAHSCFGSGPSTVSLHPTRLLFLGWELPPLGSNTR